MTGYDRQAFIIMPFENLDETFTTIIDVCSEVGIKYIRADSLYDQKPILTYIVECIGISQVLIADLTGKNANVFYELGLAHAVRRLEGIILLSQKMDDVPFDLRHLPILIYDQDKQLKLKIDLKKRLEVSLATTDSLSIIRNVLFGADFNYKHISDFIDYLSSKMSGHLQAIANYISDNNTTTYPFDKTYWSVIELMDTSNDIQKKQLQFLAISLLSTPYAMREQKGFVEEQLQPVLTSRYRLDKISNPSVIAQFCYSSIRNNFLKEECIQWLLSYLHNARVGNIDILRSQIEKWLVEDRDEDVEVALLSCLKSPIPHMREAAADILGMRRNKNSLIMIHEALEIETDPYAGRSMIAALSRGKESAYATTIATWVLENNHLWDSGPKSPSLPDTAKQALAHLGYSQQNIEAFELHVSKFRK